MLLFSVETVKTSKNTDIKIYDCELVEGWANYYSKEYKIPNKTNMFETSFYIPPFR